jgi:hypothetical protein
MVKLDVVEQAVATRSEEEALHIGIATAQESYRI